MRWRAIFCWASVGIAIGAAIILGLVEKKLLELALWLAAATVWGIAASRFARSAPFPNGFLVGFLGGYVSCLLQSVFFAVYLANNPQARHGYTSMGSEFQLDPALLRLAPAMSGVFISGVYGCVVGGVAALAARIAGGHRAA